MIFTTQHDKGIAVVLPGTDRLTAVNATAFKAEVSALVDAGSDRLIIDFEEVSFLDSSGLGALIGILKKVGSRGEIAVCSLSDSVAQMFRLTRMDRVFTTYPNADVAVKTMGHDL
jgi:anti-sigma B factor antagonist